MKKRKRRRGEEQPAGAERASAVRDQGAEPVLEELDSWGKKYGPRAGPAFSRVHLLRIRVTLAVGRTGGGVGPPWVCLPRVARDLCILRVRCAMRKEERHTLT